MEDLVLYKIRLSVLWLITPVLDFISIILYIIDPAIFKSIIDTGTIEGEKLTPEFALLGAFMLLIMFVMAFLSLTLNDKANRWSNIIVGAVYLLIWVGDMISAPGKPSKILLSIADIAFLVLIIWYAYKWPK